MNVEGGLQISDVWGIVRRRGQFVAGTSLMIALAVYWIAMALPNQFESYGTVLVTPQTVPPELVAAGVPESDLNNRLFLMTAQILSRGRLSRIIDELDLYPGESEYLVREEVIDLMRENVRVAPVLSELSQHRQQVDPNEEINQFKIFFTDHDAKTAMLVAQKLSNDFIEQHIEQRISLSQKSLEFIEEELGRLSGSIRDIEARVAGVKADNPGRLPEDMSASQRRIERLLSDLAFAQRSVSEAGSDEAFYRSQINSVQAGGNELSPERRLKALDMLISDQKSRGYTDKHPDMIKARLEIEEHKAAMAKEPDPDADPESLTSTQQTAEAERRRAALRKNSGEEEIVRLQDAIDEVQAKLAGTPAVAELLDGLEREYRHLFNSFQDFSNRRLEATVQAQLERRQLGEQFRVLEAAFIAPMPASPNRPLIIILGFVFAIGVGLAVGIVLESTDSSVHSARQLQAVVGIPVLAAIPNILLEQDLAAHRRSRIRTVFAAAAVVAFAVIGGAANYIWVNGMPSFVPSLERQASESNTEALPPTQPPAAEESGG
jgi:polysaccharide chain length determinant protein (PEP-CTERM system associated)